MIGPQALIEVTERARAACPARCSQGLQRLDQVAAGEQFTQGIDFEISSQKGENFMRPHIGYALIEAEDASLNKKTDTASIKENSSIVQQAPGNNGWTLAATWSSSYSN